MQAKLWGTAYCLLTLKVQIPTAQTNDTTQGEDLGREGCHKNMWAGYQRCVVDAVAVQKSKIFWLKGAISAFSWR